MKEMLLLLLIQQQDFFVEAKNIPWGINIFDNEYLTNIKNIFLEIGFKNI